MRKESSSAPPANDTQRMRLTIAAKAAARHADLVHKRAEQLKSDFKAAKKAYKFARKVAKKAAKKASRRAEDLELWIKRSKSKPVVKAQSRRRVPTKRKRARARKPVVRNPMPSESTSAGADSVAVTLDATHGPL